MAEAKENRPRLRRISQESLSSVAYRSIRDSIVDGRFAMGEQVKEQQVSGELGISRAPVREALRRLTEEGLLIERPRHGVFVRELNGDDLVDVYNLRLAVEGGALRLVVRAGVDLQPLERTLERMRRAADRDDLQGVINLELSLHEQICELSGNEFLVRTFRSLYALIRMALAVDDSQYGSIDEIVDEHVPLLESIRSGDEAVAVETLEKHIVSTLEPMVTSLGGDPGKLLVSPAA